MTVPLPSSVPAPTVLERPPVSKGRIAGFLGAYIGVFLIILVPSVSTLAIKIGEIAPESREATLGVIAGIGAFVAMLANPLFGSLSDRTTLRMGMRRPWILGGSIAATASVIVIAVTPSVFVIGIAWPLAQLSINAALAGLAAFLPDQVPEQQRGKVSAFTGIAQQLSPFIGLIIANVALALGGGTLGMFLAPSLIGLALIAVFAIFARDRVLSPNLVVPFRLVSLVKAFFFNPRRYPDFAWAWLGRFLISLSFSVNLTYQAYFLNDRLGIPLTEVVTAQLGFLLITTVFLSITATVSGTLSDKLRRRKPFVIIASALIATSSLLTAFSFDLPLYIVATVISGLATGAYFAVDLALVTDVLPEKETSAAKGMGIFNIATVLPQALAPALAPLFLAIGGAGSNYTALFIAAAVVAILGSLTLIPIKGVR